MSGTLEIFSKDSKKWPEAGVLGDGFRSLAGGRAGQDVIRREEDIVEAKADLARAMARHMDDFHGAVQAFQLGETLFQDLFHRGGAVAALGEEVHLHQTAPALRADPRQLQEARQSLGSHDDPFFVIRQHSPVQDMDGRRRPGFLLEPRKAAEMVDVAVGDQDEVDIGHFELGKMALAKLCKSLFDLFFAAVEAGSAIHEEDGAPVGDQVEIDVEAREGLHR